jgi:hypothetical protein
LAVDHFITRSSLYPRSLIGCILNAPRYPRSCDGLRERLNHQDCVLPLILCREKVDECLTHTIVCSEVVVALRDSFPSIFDISPIQIGGFQCASKCVRNRTTPHRQLNLRFPSRFNPSSSECVEQLQTGLNLTGGDHETKLWELFRQTNKPQLEFIWSTRLTDQSSSNFPIYHHRQAHVSDLLVIPSPTVHEQRLVDSCARTIVVCYDKVNSTDCCLAIGPEIT